MSCRNGKSNYWQSFGSFLCCNWGKQNGFWPVSKSVNTCEEVCESLRRRKRANKVTWMWSHLASGLEKVESCVVVWQCTFEHWQLQLQWVTSLFKMGHKKRAVVKQHIAWMPGCDNECNLSNTKWRKWEERYGWGVPLDTSPMRVVSVVGRETGLMVRLHLDLPDIHKEISLSSVWAAGMAKMNGWWGVFLDGNKPGENISCNVVLWQMSEVNWEIKSSWRTCEGECMCERLVIGEDMNALPSTK